MKNLLAGLVIIPVLVCGSQVTGQGTESEAHDVRLNSAHVFELERMDISLRDLSLKLEGVTLIPMETRQGFTGALIMASGSVTFKSHEADQTFEDQIETVMLRFHPDDYGQILNLVNMKPVKDEAVQRKAMHHLMSYLSRCYESGNKVFFPPRGTLAAVFNGKTYGDNILIQCDDRHSLIDPDLDELELRKDLLQTELGVMLSRAQKWRKDLQYMRLFLPRYHPNLFFRLSEERFEREIASISESAADLSDLQIYLALSKVMAKIGDSHTTINPPSVPVSIYPVMLYWLKDGLYVTGAGRDYEHILKMRLVRIGRADIETVYSTVSELIPHENESQLRKESPNIIRISEILQELGVVSKAYAGVLTFEDRKGKRIEVEVPPVPMSRMREVKWVFAGSQNDGSAVISRQRRSDFYWYEYQKDSGLLYFQYTNCKAMASKPMDAFTAELLAFVESNPIEKFVIDIRDNSGGHSPLIEPLIDGLAGSKVNRRGKLFCIIGRRTFSSAVLNAIKLRRDTKAIFVGEPSSGKPNHFGQVKAFKLPHSQLTVRHSTRYFTNSSQDTPSFMADIPVEISSAEYFAGEDPALDIILEYGAK